MQGSLAGAMNPYALWALLTPLALPWLFPINQGDVAALPSMPFPMGHPFRPTRGRH